MEDFRLSKIKVNYRTVSPKTDIIGKTFYNDWYVEDYDHDEEYHDKEGNLMHKYYYKVRCTNKCKQQRILERSKFTGRKHIICDCMKMSSSSANRSVIYRNFTFLSDGSIKIITDDGSAKYVYPVQDPRKIITDEVEFGNLLPIEFTGIKETKSGQEYIYVYNWKCLLCGDIVERDKTYVQKAVKQNPELGCSKKHTFERLENDIVGRDFENLHVDYFDHKELNTEPKNIESNSKRQDYYYHCTCNECKREFLIRRQDLFHGRKCSHEKERVYHNDEVGYESFRKIHEGIIQRCTNPNSQGYENYGGRGITVCDRWRSYYYFKMDMFESYKEKVDSNPGERISIDRIDNDKGYSPDNCRWATDIEQQNNKRNNRRFGYMGGRYTVRQLLNLFVIDNEFNYDSLFDRLTSVKLKLLGWVDDNDNILTYRALTNEYFRERFVKRTPIFESNAYQRSIHEEEMKHLPRFN